MSDITGGAHPVEITSGQQFIDLLAARSQAATMATPSLAGKPYCPGSGTEGMAFEDAFCCKCVYYRLDEETSCFCPISDNAHDIADIKDPLFPSQWRYDDEGYPTCTSFRERDNVPDANYERALYEKAMRGE